MGKYIYNDGEEITEEEAHALEDKSKLCSSDKEIKFKKPEVVGKPKGAKKNAK